MESVTNLYNSTKQKAQDNPRRTAIWVGLFILFVLSFLVPVDQPHVALSGEPIFSNGPKWFTNSILTTVIVDIFLLIIAFLATRNMKMIPSGLQNVFEAILEYLFNLSESVAGKDARRYFPWVVTIFLFVIFSNWSGLIPGVGSIGMYHETEAYGEEIHTEEAPADGEHDGGEEHNEEQPAEGGEHGYSFDRQLAMADGNLILVETSSAAPAPAAAAEGHKKFIPLFRAPSADLNMTFALALVIMTMVQVFGVRALGGSYFGKFFAWRGPNVAMKSIGAFVGILELVSELSRIVAFGFRLFGNIFAGEIVLATMAFLIAFLLPIPFYILEIFVGFVQALVFMMLALVFFSMATISHDSEHH